MSEAELQALVRSIEELRDSTTELRASTTELRASTGDLRTSHLETDRVLRESHLETDRALKESRLETDQALKESRLETDQALKESHLETDRVLRESRLETDRVLKESKAKTDEALRKLSSLFSSQWGKLVEALVAPGCVLQFRERGIAVERSVQRAEGKDDEGREMEIDVLLMNGNEIVAIEVKTTCKPADVDEHEQRLRRFKRAYPEYASKTVYGALAAITYESSADKYAYRRGFFVLKPIHGVTTIVNHKGFQPKRF